MGSGKREKMGGKEKWEGYLITQDTEWVCKI